VGLPRSQKIAIGAGAGGAALILLLLALLARARRKRRLEAEQLAMLPRTVREIEAGLAPGMLAEGEAPGVAPALVDPRTLALEAAKSDPVRAAEIVRGWLHEVVTEGAPVKGKEGAGEQAA
jgi:hypothetical protein